MLWNCLFLYQKQPLRDFLKNRYSEFCNQNPWTTAISPGNCKSSYFQAQIFFPEHIQWLLPLYLFDFRFSYSKIQKIIRELVKLETADLLSGQLPPGQLSPGWSSSGLLRPGQLPPRMIAPEVSPRTIADEENSPPDN